MIQYRQATESDALTLIDIARRVIKHCYTPFLGADMIAEFIDSGMSDREIYDGIPDCIVVVCDQQIIGFAITKGELLHLIMVDVNFQNAGYGSDLLRYIENRLFREFNSIRLQTFEKNQPSVKFYLKNGWTITENEEVPAIGMTMLVFHKQRS